MRVGIVADDLTGAADSAAPFAARGLSAMVALTAAAVVEADVVAIDTDSRGGPAPTRVAEAFRALSADLLVKKIDSTLRGHVALEIVAALEATGAEQAVVAPAYPAMGRQVRGGRLIVDGRDVCDAAERCGRDVRDAETHEDLVAIVRSAPRRVLWVGSAGLATALAATLPAAPVPALPTGSPVLVVAGSPSPVTRRQLAVLADAGVAIAGDAESARSLLARGEDAVVTNPRTGAAAAGLAGALVVTGGATARGLAGALGLDRLWILGAPEPGLAAGLLGDRPVVLKAGGFGSPRTLLDAMRRLRG